MLLKPGVSLADEGASPINVKCYGSLRVQGEYVRPDNQDALNDYWGVRDAYSRIGTKIDYSLNSVTFFAQLEIPLDTANFKIQGPYEQNSTASHNAGQLTDSLRVGKIGVRGGFGTLAYGQNWLPYYNAIAYPVDMFSSYYSGFGAFTPSRRSHTAVYYSPDFAGFSFAGGYSHEGGRLKANGTDYSNRYQLTASYSFGNTILSAGLDDSGGKFNTRLYGLSLQHTVPKLRAGSLYLGAKIERFDSGLRSGFGADGDMAMNLFAGYALGKNTFKLHLADVENYGDRILHLGLDHQLTPRLKLFAEYYNEQSTAAMTTRRGGAADTVWDANGGQVFLMGGRYDF